MKLKLVKAKRLAFKIYNPNSRNKMNMKAFREKIQIKLKSKYTKLTIK